ncbi:alpha/beta hydrolase [Variovorax sp. OV329]|uniref:alpha/beta hydrolase n=1 Tax=Variovorax sp. OV329 TaxID=1882825 RepID=UPI0008E7CA52|nr:alpha/beta hydrolase [Variovorax sp. OV329]SFM75706.1 hypothetical protein SAMN05444747_108163 [Variovorax sp. OV329]
MARAAFTRLSRSALLALPIFLLGGCVESMFFHPDRVRYATPAALGLRFEPLSFRSTDGTLLSAWFIPAVGRADSRQARGTVIHFHGNAQNMSAHRRFVAWLPRKDFNVFVFDYRGYGESAGKPEARGLFEDSVSAIRHVRSRPDVDPARLLVFGQSLGGTNAIAAVGSGQREGVRAVAIESTFYSYSSIADDTLRGAGLLVGDTYAASRYVAGIAPIPLLFIHGTRDAVIPLSHSQRLLADAHEPKRLVEVPGAGHMEPMGTERFGDTYQRVLVDFFEAALKQAPAAASR